MSKKTETKEAPKTRTFEITVKGMTYYVTISTMRNMAKKCPMHVIFEREPNNRYDPNAIKVILDAEPWRGFHIGHVARQTAVVLAPQMDAGEFHPEETWLMWVNPDKSEGGVLVKVKR